MTRWMALSTLVLLGVAAIWVSERRKVDVAAGPSALLYLIGDTEQELTRMPVSFTKMSDKEEIDIGNRMAASYDLGREVKKDAEVMEVESYLDQVGSRLAARAHRRLQYKFHYIADDGFINAFALPGGHVYVGAGLMAMMDSEDELAAVVGHEMEHIDHYHCAERVQQEKALRKIPLGGLMGLPIELFEAGYSKDQELEADREGTRLAVESGYSANGAIRMFETFQRLYEEYHARIRTPQDELARVATETLEGYFRSHPLPSERIAQIQKMIASQNWQAHAERELAVGYVFWTKKAERVLEAKHYPQAQQSALRSLEIRAAQPKALLVLARAQFGQADFAGAAGSYRRLLDLDASGSDNARSYAQALAAADRRTAAAKFQQWMDDMKGGAPQDLEVLSAGLALLAGDTAQAKSVEAKARGSEGIDWAPKWLGELGWWYYVAGEHARAAELINEAIQLRPGDAMLTTQKAWALIEDRRLSDALDSLQSTYGNGNFQRDRQMAQAVVYWLSHQTDSAVGDYRAAIDLQPEWNNPRWVEALYSRLVSASVKEMQAEVERRRKLRLAAVQR
jgi:beta-barrel assembly-enhancing protease